jgi:hypothetical protein
MKRSIIVGLLVAMASISVRSQEIKFSGFLPAYSQTGKINQRLHYNIFISSTFDAFSSLQNGVFYPAKDLQWYCQPSIVFTYSKKMNVAASYTYQRNNPLDLQFSNEHRFWEQIIFTQPLILGNLNHRIRLEERLMQFRDIYHFTYGTRLRYQCSLIKPLNGKTIDAHEFYWNCYNESYFSLSGPKNALYSENWIYTGFGYDTGKKGRIEMGYMNQIFVRNTAHDWRVLNLLYTGWVTRF